MPQDRPYLLLALVLVPVLAFLRARRPKRSSKLPRATERVVILGASSGIGRTLAHQYARLGVRGVCVVGRRADKVAEVVQECEIEVGKSKSGKGAKTEVLGIAGDFADPGDMVEVRRRVEAAWGGLDTLIVAAGVSALRPLMEVAGASTSESGSVGKDAIQHVVDVTGSATRGNYIGPLVAAVTFIPLLQHSSPRPALLLLNSLAAAIPAPTRGIYASTKAASLHLYQAIAIEHPKIAVSLVMPSTVEGDFRRGAVDAAVFGASNADGGDGMSAVREADPNKHGFKREVVAQRCVDAIERGEKNVFMPGAVGLGHLLYWVWPAFVEPWASRKYKYKVANRRVLPPDMPKEAKPKRKAAEKAEKAPRGKGKKYPNALKRALSAYMFFSQDWRERIKTENPDAGYGEVGRLLGVKWNELDDEEKKPYVEQAAKDKTRAEDEKIAYEGGKKSAPASGGEEDDASD